MDAQFGRELPGQEGNYNAIAKTRNPYFAAVYSEMNKQVKSGAPIVGALFWQWLRDDRAQGPNANSIKTYDSTFYKCVGLVAAMRAVIAVGLESLSSDASCHSGRVRIPVVLCLTSKMRVSKTRLGKCVSTTSNVSNVTGSACCSLAHGCLAPQAHYSFRAVDEQFLRPQKLIDGLHPSSSAAPLAERGRAGRYRHQIGESTASSVIIVQLQERGTTLPRSWGTDGQFHSKISSVLVTANFILQYCHQC